jgi:Transposase
MATTGCRDGGGKQVETLVERCAGLDVDKASVTACVRVPDGRGGRHAQTRTFATTTSGLVLLAEWMGSFGVTRVGMESTGCYWKPVWQLLEDQVECWLLNAAHLHSVPGRKTDVADAAWIAQLVEHGLVRPSFVPPRPIQELRDLTRYRKTQIQERGREVQRLDKVLQDAGIKLSSVATDIIGVSGRAMPEALVPAPMTVPHRPLRAAGRPDPGPHRLPGRDHRGAVGADRAGDRPVRPTGGAAGHHPRDRPACRRGHRGRDRPGHGPVPHRRASGLVGGGVPWE